MANKEGQYFMQKGMISEEYLAVWGRQPEESHTDYEVTKPCQWNVVTLLAIELVIWLHYGPLFIFKNININYLLENIVEITLLKIMYKFILRIFLMETKCHYEVKKCPK